MTWDDEITDVIEARDAVQAIVIAPERLDALCRVVEAILTGHFDEQSLSFPIISHDRFSRLESLLQALCHQLSRISGRRARRTPD
jgi:hypothetical protein